MRGEKLSSAQASIQQFQDAYLAWLPNYIDYVNETYGDMETMSRKQQEHKEGRKISGSWTQPTLFNHFGTTKPEHRLTMTPLRATKPVESPSRIRSTRQPKSSIR